MNCAPFLASFANSHADQSFYGKLRNCTMFFNGNKNKFYQIFCFQMLYKLYVTLYFTRLIIIIDKILQSELILVLLVLKETSINNLL